MLQVSDLVLPELNLIGLIILNRLIGVLMDLITKSMFWILNKYINGKIFSLASPDS